MINNEHEPEKWSGNHLCDYKEEEYEEDDEIFDEDIDDNDPNE